MALADVRILDVRILVDGVVHRAVSRVRAAHGTFPMHPRIGTRLNPVCAGSFGVAWAMTMIYGLPVVGARAGGEPS